MFEYNSLIEEHFFYARHIGTLQETEPFRLAHAQIGDQHSACIMHLYMLIDANNIIRNARFKCFGCPCAIASLSKLCDSLIGLSLDKASRLNSAWLMEALQLPPHKRYCALYAEDVLNAALLEGKSYN